MSMPTRLVDVGFTSPTTSNYLHLGDAARGKLGTGTLAPTGILTDVSDFVSGFSTRMGATRTDEPNLRFEAGTSSIILRNEDRRFDPTNLSGPYVSAGVTQVEPMRAVRLRATWAGVTYPLWRGFADDWQVTYDPPNVSTVVLTATDAFKVFNAYDRAAGGSVGGGEDSGARISRILDSISWPDTDRIVATGDSTLQATTLAANTLTELLLTADSELGQFYVDMQGRAHFRNRHAPMTETRSNTSQATFGDGAGELPYADLRLSYSEQALFNLVTIARAGGTEQTAEDATSRQQYLTRTYGRDDLLLETDAEALAYADFILGQSSKPELRFTEMVLKPQRDPDNLFPQVLGRAIGDRITVIRRPPGGGDPIQRDVFIVGITHTVTDETWETTFTLQSATHWGFFVLGNSALGVLDQNMLAY